MKFSFLFLILFVLAILTNRLDKFIFAFSIVIFHEIFHIFEALLHGLRVVEVELLPVGGVARVQETIEVNPSIESRVALAGPLSSILLAELIFFYNQFSNLKIPISTYEFLFYGNLFLGFFNLIPAFPLDGGRIFRAILTKHKGYKIATEKVVIATKIAAFGLSILNIIGFFKGFLNPAPFIIGWIMYSAALYEREISDYMFIMYLNRKREEISRRKLIEVTKYAVLESIQLKDILRKISTNRFHIFVVLDEKLKIVDTLTEIDIVNCFLEKGSRITMKELVDKAGVNKADIR